MTFQLVVTSPFGGYAAGDVISDPEAVDLALLTHAERVVRIVASRPTAPKED